MSLRLSVRAFALLFVAVFIPSLHAQQPSDSRAPAPKRELRAVWIATVANIDYPRTPTTDPVPLKEQYRNLLDQLDEIGINTVIVQVRPAGDAFYNSQLAPWSRFLTGRQGQAPADGFDPLAFMIDETHQRGMEFHAWINPYRAANNLDSTALSPDHALYKHPDWLVTYGKGMYFDPGLPEVRQHLVEVVGELVGKYDVDGIHVDDYFYPYPIANTPFPDSASYLRYGQSFSSIQDWRRGNTDAFVQETHQAIKKLKPWVVFGISPFGVWRNMSQDSVRGSATRAGATSYDDLYADVLKWMERGWIDYVAPQLYWNIGFAPADYTTLLQWWSQYAIRHQVHLYVGHGAYKVGDNPEPAWKQPAELPRQIDLCRRNVASTGSIFFSTKSVINNPLGIKDSLRRMYQHLSLWPQREALQVLPLKQPELRRLRFREEGVRLQWRPNARDVELSKNIHYYAIYRFSGNEKQDLDRPGALIHISAFEPTGKKFTFYDRATQPGETYTYVITACNRAHVESPPSEAQAIERTERGGRRVRNKPAG